ncbi:MAG: isochorismatase family protein [Mycobacterium sp.]|nr:isochorismatase family protein [Mycobacterium sp.]
MYAFLYRTALRFGSPTDHRPSGTFRWRHAGDPGTSTAVPRITSLCHAFRSTSRPIVHIVRLYLADGSNAEPVRKDLVAGPIPMLRAGTPGRLLAAALTPDPNTCFDDELLLSGRPQQLGDREIILYKPRWGAFFGTVLDDYLRDNGIDTVVVACAALRSPPAAVTRA